MNEENLLKLQRSGQSSNKLKSMFDTIEEGKAQKQKSAESFMMTLFKKQLAEKIEICGNPSEFKQRLEERFVRMEQNSETQVKQKRRGILQSLQLRPYELRSIQDSSSLQSDRNKLVLELASGSKESELGSPQQSILKIRSHPHFGALPDVQQVLKTTTGNEDPGSRSFWFPDLSVHK